MEALSDEENLSEEILKEVEIILSGVALRASGCEVSNAAVTCVARGVDVVDDDLATTPAVGTRIGSKHINEGTRTAPEAAAAVVDLRKVLGATFPATWLQPTLAPTRVGEGAIIAQGNTLLALRALYLKSFENDSHSEKIGRRLI